MKSQRWTDAEIPDQTGRIALVTGANSGIGYEAARVLAEKGATVVLACRSQARGTDAVARIEALNPTGEVRFEALDLASLKSVADFADRMKGAFPAIDLLINNAGVMIPPFSRTEEGLELQFGVNHLGHFALTAQLLPHLKAEDGSRVVVLSSVASRMGPIDYDDPNYERKPYKAWAAYCQSKLANLVFAEHLEEKLNAAGSPVHCVAAHPGWTNTDLQRSWLAARIFGKICAMKAPQGALPTLYAATAPDARGGCFYGPDGLFEARGYPVGVKKQNRTNRAAFTAENKEGLWTLSEEMTGMKFEV